MKNVNILHFNVWDIPVSQHRTKRIKGLARILEENREEYDIVGLLECWLEKDRNMLIEAGKRGGLEHHVFFRNGCGFPGGQSSGLVVLSRWPIENTFYHRYTASGKAQKILHWDYSVYSGKGIGVVHIQGPPQVGPIDLYISHFVAYYTAQPEDPEHDEYVYHRRLGAWEASQFIRSTVRPGSFVAMLVDLNADPDTLTYDTLTGLSGLKDSWKVVGRSRKDQVGFEKEEEAGLTVNYNGNCYFENNAWIASGEPSARVDYVLYCPNHPRLVPDWCERRFSGPESYNDKNPEDKVSLSDHSAVLASFKVIDDQPELDYVSLNGKSLVVGEEPIPHCVMSKEMLDQLVVSTQAGILDSLSRRRKALLKMQVFSLISILSMFTPLLLGYGILPALLQYLVGTGFAVSAAVYFVLASITIPDEESAMKFMMTRLLVQRIEISTP